MYEKRRLYKKYKPKGGYLMLFSSITFLFYFLPIVLIIYYFLREKYRNIFLLLASLLFYAWGEPKFVIIMIVSIIINYLFALGIDKCKKKESRRLLLKFTVVMNLGILVVFKYLTFFETSVNSILGNLKIANIPIHQITLPIGISFFTFQGLSYVIDVYWKKVDVQKNIIKLGLYISLFPQLIAGPIVRYIDVEKEISDRRQTISDFSSGIRRFIIGLSKKVLLANTLGQVADNIFALELNAFSTVTAWLGIICYALQIYFDFSGYSDMAIGLGRMFGFHFIENFNYPYISKSITEFWRRWHISLSTWFKDYLYIPLGGNRKGKVRTYINLIIVFFTTGLWHGASFNFVFWGLYYGFFLVIEKTQILKKIFKIKKDNKILNTIGHIYTILVVLVGWVFFRTESMSSAVNYVKKLFFMSNTSRELFSFTYYFDSKTILFLIVALIASMPIVKKVQKYFNNRVGEVLRDIVLVTLLFITMVTLSNSTYNPFIYFRF